jgi:hypothetical protein
MRCWPGCGDVERCRARHREDVQVALIQQLRTVLRDLSDASPEDWYEAEFGTEPGYVTRWSAPD